jgi:hypothetical protein
MIALVPVYLGSSAGALCVNRMASCNTSRMPKRQTWRCLIVCLGVDARNGERMLNLKLSSIPSGRRHIETNKTINTQ